VIFLYVVLTLSLATLLVFGVVEQRRHFDRLDSIPVRVLVNGIRGKSSITRLCAGALRGGGLRVVAKTTGTAARVIWPDGSEEEIYRKFGIPNVTEQIEVVRRAAATAPDVMVLECMAVMPALQETNQEKLVRSNIGIISNVREDHLTEMGPTLEEVARSLCRSMPVGGMCVTAEAEWLHVLEQEAARRECRLVVVAPDAVSDDEMEQFSYFTFKENVAIALRIAAELGVPRDLAVLGMREAAADPWSLAVDEYYVEGKLLRFANVFAANDPSSTLMNVHQLSGQGAIREPLYALINCRPDRLERNAQMGALVTALAAEKVFLIGHPTRSATVAIPRRWAGEVIDLGGARREPEDIFRSIVHEVNGEATVVAIGNIHGQGEALLEHLEQLGALR